MVEASTAFVPVFVDTLDRDQPFERFGESYGSYPVLRVHDPRIGEPLRDPVARDLAGRIDGNAVKGRIPVEELLRQLERGRAAYGASPAGRRP